MKYIKFLNEIVKGYRIVMILLFILMAFLAYTRSIIPQFLSYAIDSILLGVDTQFVGLFDSIVKLGDDQYSQLVLLCVVLVGFQIFRAIIMYFRTYMFYTTTEKIMLRFRDRLYLHLQNLPFSYFKRNNSGDIIQRATTDVDAIRTFLSSELFQFVWTFSILSATLYAMFQISVIYTLATASVVPFIFAISLFYSYRIQKQYHLIDHNEGEMTDAVKENITNVEVVKAFGSQKYEYDKYLEKSKPYYEELANFFKSLAKMESSVLFFKMSQYLIVLLFGVYLIEQNEITIGTIVLFLSYTKLLSNPIKMLGRLLSRVGRLTVAITRIAHIFEEPLETIELEEPEIKGEIEFNNVSYQFEDETFHTIKDVNFKIRRGSNVAIIGKTGSGKSTLINLLCRLYEPTVGNIYIDGHDISKINKKYLRSNLGVVVQEPYIFSRNVMQNIAITQSEYKSDDVINYAKVASIHNDIVDFKDGYETIVGEHGATLSGGQRQRLAIARTLLAEHNILVFDDSLSAVDNETDKNIRKSLMENSEITTITITHKVTSILEYDQVIVLENGTVIEDGTVDTLLSSNGYFKELYELQMGGK